MDKKPDLINKFVVDGGRVVLFGVTFALLDLAEKYACNLPALLSHLPANCKAIARQAGRQNKAGGADMIIMETGGMKGRRKELLREDLHNKLKNGFGVQYIHSEYGMTELMSQAYSKGCGKFMTPPWMSVILRDFNDPLNVNSKIKTGGINIIDLANVDSCAFIETQDLGRLNSDGSFEVLGRIDNADIRGCSLMYDG